jgi:hypothetical protein
MSDHVLIIYLPCDALTPAAGFYAVCLIRLRTAGLSAVWGFVAFRVNIHVTKAMRESLGPAAWLPFRSWTKLFPEGHFVNMIAGPGRHAFNRAAGSQRPTVKRNRPGCPRNTIVLCSRCSFPVIIRSGSRVTWILY